MSHVLPALAALLVLVPVSEGKATRYSPGTMDRVVSNRLRWKQITHEQIRAARGFIALADQCHIGDMAWIRWPNGHLTGPYLVADCGRDSDQDYLKKIGFAVDLSYELALQFGVIDRPRPGVRVYVQKEQTVKIYDRNGIERNIDWLAANYGRPVIRPALPGLGWRIAEIREVGDPRPTILASPASPAATNTLIVSARTADGQPAAGLNIAWYWPDAPENHGAMPPGGIPAAMQPGRAEVAPTNQAGDIGFGMGRGAYYWPDKAQIGPHAVWVAGANSDLILGLGMIGGTAHDHLDVVFQQSLNGQPIDPPPDGDHWETLFQRLDRIIVLLADVA